MSQSRDSFSIKMGAKGEGEVKGMYHLKGIPSERLVPPRVEKVLSYYWHFASPGTWVQRTLLSCMLGETRDCVRLLPINFSFDSQLDSLAYFSDQSAFHGLRRAYVYLMTARSPYRDEARRFTRLRDKKVTTSSLPRCRFVAYVGMIMEAPSVRRLCMSILCKSYFATCLIIARMAGTYYLYVCAQRVIYIW